MTDEENAAWRKQRALRLFGEAAKKKRKGGPGRPPIINNAEQVKWILGHIAGGYIFKDIPAVGCSRWTWWRTFRRYPKVRELQDSAREWRRKHWRENGGPRRNRQRKHSYCTPVYAGETVRFRPKKFRSMFIDQVRPSIGKTAAVLGVAKSTVWVWSKRIPEFKAKLEEESLRAFRVRILQKLEVDGRRRDALLLVTADDRAALEQAQARILPCPAAK